MIMTNEECSKFVANSMEDLKGKLVYVLSFDDLPFLLEKGKIEKKRFVGFTRDFPMHLGHGNVAIVFKRSKLRKKYKMIDVEYTEEFMNKNPSIKNHFLEGYTENEWAEHMINKNEAWMQQYKNQPQTEEIEKIVSEFEISNNMIKKYPLEACLRALKNENETLIKRNIVNFDIDDIYCIIYPSKSFLKYYPVKGIYHKKIIFVNDYVPIELEEGSPLKLWYAFVSYTIESFKKTAIVYENDLPFLFLYVYGMSTNMRKFAKTTPRGVNRFPDDIDYLLKNMNKILNKEWKVNLTHFLSLMEILPGWKGSEGQYEFAIGGTIKQLREREE